MLQIRVFMLLGFGCGYVLLLRVSVFASLPMQCVLSLVLHQFRTTQTRPNSCHRVPILAKSSLVSAAEEETYFFPKVSRNEWNELAIGLTARSSSLTGVKFVICSAWCKRVCVVTVKNATKRTIPARVITAHPGQCSLRRGMRTSFSLWLCVSWMQTHFFACSCFSLTLPAHDTHRCVFSLRCDN